MWNESGMTKAGISEICHRVAEYRERAGFTQIDMARQLNVQRDTYKQWEIRTPMPVEYWEDFCRLTGADVYWLLTGRHKAPPLVTPEQLRWVRMIEGRTPEKRDALLALLED